MGREILTLKIESDGTITALLDDMSILVDAPVSFDRVTGLPVYEYGLDMLTRGDCVIA